MEALTSMELVLLLLKQRYSLVDIATQSKINISRLHRLSKGLTNRPGEDMRCALQDAVRFFSDRDGWAH